MGLKILIIRFSSMGDVVLTSPVIRCLHEQLPSAEIHYLTKGSNYELLRANPYLHRIHLLDVNEAKVITQLQKEGFDYIIDLHHNLRSLKFKRALKGKSRSFNKLNFEKWLLVNFKINRMPAVHIVDRYLATVAVLGVKNDGKGLDCFLPEDARLLAADYDSRLANGYVAFSIGGQHATKQLPKVKIMEICKLIDLPILLLGGKEEQQTATEVVAACTNQVIVSACGQVGINQSADLVRQARVVLSHDTALMHLSAAFNRPTLAIWGNTVPALGMYPYLPQHPERFENMEVLGLNCRPCSKIGHKSCPKGHFKCMQLQDSAFIAQRARHWFAQEL